MGLELTGILVAVLFALVVILIKFLICNCLLIRRMREEDGIPILSRGDTFWRDYEARQARLGRAPPPPDFEEALRTSRPVSYIDLEEEPPPTYQDFLTTYNSNSPSSSSGIGSSFSLNESSSDLPTTYDVTDNNVNSNDSNNRSLPILRFLSEFRSQVSRRSSVASNSNSN